MQFKENTHREAEMSSKEALDLDGSKRKGRARKEGPVWESRIMVKTDTQLSPTDHITQQKTHSRSSTMRNAEIQVGKKVDKITPKQNPTAAAATAKSKKTVEMARQRSDLGIKKSPPQIKRARSAATSTSVRDEINSVKLRKLKSDSAKAAENSLPLQFVNQRTTKSDDEKVVSDLDQIPLGIENSRFEADSQVKAITENADQIPPPPDLDLEEEEEEEEEQEQEQEQEEQEEQEEEVEVEKRSVEIKDIIISLQENKPKKLVNEDRSPPLTPIVKEIAPAARIKQKLNPISDHHRGTASRLQSLADLIMWRDASRSAFVFGVGAFAIISSSYATDLNISCISVLSYLGLVYLAVSFIFRSILNRGNIDMDSKDEEYVVGEEEAVWLIKLILPYLNEFLSKLRSLFSGDPATTMKLAVLLFILARCGGSITIWKMTKLGFFGVFMVPKLCSSYSSQLAAYGTFWIRRFGDAWESCSHKKAVAFGIFSLVWNLSSIVVRFWAVFILFVAFRYYRQCCIKEEAVLQEEAVAQNSGFRYSGNRVQARKSNVIDMQKHKKVF